MKPANGEIVNVIEGLTVWAKPHLPRMESGFNGYAQFPSRPTKTVGYGGILVYVPVHGGITYAEQEANGYVYGFDTLHCYSANYPRMDPEWIFEQIEVMIRGIRLAAELEDEYLLAEGDNEKRAAIAQKVRDVAPGAPLNFMECINLLCGGL